MKKIREIARNLNSEKDFQLLLTTMNREVEKDKLSAKELQEVWDIAEVAKNKAKTFNFGV